ncbi:ABC transporter ATP-binding protein [Thaumasiovibrio subtropicus]|uniref:ABC transporter ATP-binding protein n=1 Tax=Thaumasiovibrio subtropicus TaxID=1891207 RepID=UPI000B362803|nr:ABC transporter ATP-binding protein [Thaumasiovibrio subtropicus]
MPHLLSISNLHVGFQKGDHRNDVVHGVTLHIDKGETLALVGESGSGKSVTAMSILQLLPQPQTQYPQGLIQFAGRNTLAMKPRELRHLRGNKVGVIFQEPMMSLNPLHTIEKQLAEVLEIHKGLTKKDAYQKVYSWLKKVELREPEKKMKAYPHELSGGEQQRVMIAMALINEPELLIADEPTTALDVTVQDQILTLIKQLQHELGMAILFITHDFNVVRRVADRIAVMEHGRIVETDTTAQIFNAPQHDYTKTLLSAEPDGQAVGTPSENILLAVDNLRVWFPIQKGIFKRTVDYFKAVDGVSLNIHKGETVGIVGESGSGKSTTANAILRLLDSQGEMHFAGQRIDNLNHKEMLPYRSKIQVVFQDPYGSLSPRMSVAQIIGEGLTIHTQLTAEAIDERIVDVMAEVGLDPESRHRYPNEFSGGQRQRIAIARAIVLQPELLILDEPTSSLDRSVQYQVLALLKTLQETYQLSYLFISHDLKVVKSLCHRVIVMKDGKVVEAGDVERVFEKAQTDYTHTLLRTAFA